VNTHAHCTWYSLPFQVHLAVAAIVMLINSSSFAAEQSGRAANQRRDTIRACLRGTRLMTGC
jgi:hypothetical protein